MRLGNTAVAGWLTLTAVALGQAEYVLHELVAPEGALDVVVVAIDAQGRLAGSSRFPTGRVAVTWESYEAQPVVLGSLDPGQWSEATGLAGGTVVGVSGRACGFDGAFLWRGAVEPLGPDVCVPTRAIDINEAGEVLLLVGDQAQPLVWPAGAGSPRVLETWSQPATALSIDTRGGVLGASAHHPEGLGRTRAIRWAPDGTAQLLGMLDPDARGPDVALDANIAGMIVGQSRVGSLGRATVWDASGVPFDAGQALGPSVGSSLSRVNDGGVAVGVTIDRAIVWDSARGARLLLPLVDESGSGWTLNEATGINNRGLIIGNGRRSDSRPRGFVLVPLGVSCRADMDGDGVLTIFDFLTFQNLFAVGDPRADFDGDGQFTIFDFLEFQNAFAAGCP